MSTIFETLKKNDLVYTNIQAFSKGTTLFYEGDICHKIGIIIYGKVEIVGYTLNGNKVIYAHLKEGDAFGNNLLFSNDKHYRGDVIVIEDAKICFINEDNILEILKNNTDFLTSFLRYQAEQGKNLNMKIKLLSIPSAEERFLYYLSVNNGSITINSITELSTKIFLERETVSRLISKLIKNKIIKKNKNNIILL